MQHIRGNLLISALVCVVFGGLLILQGDSLAIGLGAPISLCGLIMFVWGMNLKPEELGWSQDKIAEWTPSAESLPEAGRIMYRVDTTLDEPIKTTIQCGGCGKVTSLDGARPKAFECPACAALLWEQEEE